MIIILFLWTVTTMLTTGDGYWKTGPLPSWKYHCLSVLNYKNNVAMSMYRNLLWVYGFSYLKKHCLNTNWMKKIIWIAWNLTFPGLLNILNWNILNLFMGNLHHFSGFLNTPFFFFFFFNICSGIYPQPSLQSQEIINIILKKYNNNNKHEI